MDSRLDLRMDPRIDPTEMYPRMDPRIDARRCTVIAAGLANGDLPHCTSLDHRLAATSTATCTH
jgi:hypothetical protein